MNKNFIDLTYVADWISGEQLFSWESPVQTAHQTLVNGSGAGSDFTGWLSLPEKSFRELPVWSMIISEFKKELDAVVVIGIGGSYLGARALIEGCTPQLGKNPRGPEMLYAGHNLSENYHHELLRYLEDREWGIIVISKSGTTTEPAIAFRILKNALEKRFGKEKSRKRVIAITDQHHGALRQLAGEMAYPTFIIPDDVGGRFSVFSPVGIIPIMVAGLSAEQFLKGALNAMERTDIEVPFGDNPAAIYASVRNALLAQGKEIEIMAGFQPKMRLLAEWWKQLFGESEGKEHKGIFPASADFTTDLHSMGQYIQEGRRNLFETFILWENSTVHLTIPEESADLDQLNYLSGWSLDRVNEMAALGTVMAHHDGGVPGILIRAGVCNEFNIGQLMYIFQKACGISGYLLGVNPFDQPGVEAYKRNMFRLLKKPGYSES